MRTQTVVHNGISVVVRSRYRRTPIIAAQYMEALRRAYPAIVAFEADMFQIDMPADPNDRAQAATYETRIVAARARHELGAEYLRVANAIVPLLARISGITGALFTLGPDGRFDDANVIRAFEQAADEDGDDPDTLWGEIAAAVAVVDAPLTPVEDRPPETLTEVQRRDPLSAAAD